MNTIMSTPQVYPSTSSDNGAFASESSIIVEKRNNISYLTEMSKQNILASEKMNNIKETTNQLELEKEESPIEVIRVATKKFMSTHWLGILYFNILLAISVASCLQYIFQTYLQVEYIAADIRLPRYVSYAVADSHNIILWFDKIEIGLASLFMFDWILSFFMADHKWFFVTSFYSMVDLLTVIPIWITRYGVECVYFSQINSLSSFCIYILCGLKTTRILRALRIKKKLNRIEDDIERCLGEISLLIIVMILFNSAVMQYLEQETQVLPFHTWMYYIWITIATVGYGDISPITDLGRIGAMIMICVAIVSIPKMTNELIEKMALQSVYQRAHFMPKGRKSEHIVICGDLSSVMLEEFFAELFHEDHENENLHVVVLQPTPPSLQMCSKILEHTVYQIAVTYLEGTALLEKDLLRAKASSSLAVLIMTNKFGENPDDEDAKTILNQASIKRHIANLALDKNSSNSIAVVEPLLCLQLHRPENKRHLHFDKDAQDKNMILCLNEIKLGVIAKTVLFPGVNTLIVNLLTSFADGDNEDEGGAGRDEGLEVENLDDEEDNWEVEYLKGCGWEIYTTELSSVFEGQKFSILSDILYQKLGIVLFALEIEDLEKGFKRLLLNPGDFVIPSQELFTIEAFVIARNKKESDLSFSDESDDNNGEKLPENKYQTKNQNLFEKSFDGKPEQTDSMSVDGAEGVVKEFAWQSLIRKYESAAAKTVSLQEESQKIEEIELRKNYYIRSVPCTLESCIVEASVNADVPNLDKHIIIIGKNVNNLYDLIRPLRARYLEVLKYIVILCPVDIPIAVWRRICVFEALLVVKGSGLEESDLRRACVYRASQVVVLADSGQLRSSSGDNNRKNSGEAEALVDADAIFTFQSVKKMNERASVVLEIVRHQNVAYITENGGSQEDYKFSPLFAGGVLFTSSFLDALVCQSFYNPKIIRVLSELIGGVDTKQIEKKKKGLNSIVSSCLYQIPIPDNLPSRTYEALYKHLSKENIIPCGLYRGVFPQTRTGPKHNNMSYVYTNPSKDTELFTCDKVFVFSQTPITNSKINSLEAAKEIVFNEERRILQRGIKEVGDLSNKVSSLVNDIASLKETNEAMHRDIGDMKGDLISKVDALLQRSLEHPESSSNRYLASSASLKGSLSISSNAGLTRKRSDSLDSIERRKDHPQTNAVSILSMDGKGGYRASGKPTSKIFS